MYKYYYVFLHVRAVYPIDEYSNEQIWKFSKYKFWEYRDTEHSPIKSRAWLEHIPTCLFVVDSIVDIKTAQNANVSSVGVLWGNGDKEDFKKQKSDFILDRPQDILDILD